MSLDTSRHKLHSALKTLRLHWAQVESQWRDPVRQQFEERYWNTLEPAVLATVAAIDTLSQVLMQSRRECR